MTEFILMPVGEILALRSDEARLLCARGHVTATPRTCPNGCTPFVGAMTVAHVIPFKCQITVERLAGILLEDCDLPPLQVEDGWLLNGHHRVAAAVRAGVPALAVREVSGVLADQIAFHNRVRQSAFRPKQAAAILASC